MPEAARPAGADERVHSLDALRGFALLGILVANIRDWSAWAWMGPESRVALAGEVGTRFNELVYLALIQGKFYTIFAMLFGVSFALQLSRLEKRGQDGLSLYRRRLALLLLIGLAHVSLVWVGDILTLYAALGFLLPLFWRVPGSRLPVFAAALVALPVAGYVLVARLGYPPDLGLYAFSYELADRLYAAFVGGERPPDLEWVRQSSWEAYWAWSLSGPPHRLGTLLADWRIPKVLGVMLIGLWAGRRLVAGELLQDRGFLGRVARGGLLIGLPANAAYALLGGLEASDFRVGLATTALYAIGVVPLGLAYAAGFMLLWRRGQRWLSSLQAPGRMALTNYLSQSVLGVSIFYGIGLGMVGITPPLAFNALAIAIFAGQVLLSRWWLRSFSQGPAEWLWRLGTYSRWLRWRRD